MANESRKLGPPPFARSKIKIKILGDEVLYAFLLDSTVTYSAASHVARCLETRFMVHGDVDRERHFGRHVGIDRTIQY